MASRIGKYKVSKKESAISLVDGGNVSGTLTIDPKSTIELASSVTGVHEYYEEVAITTADDNDVAASLSIKLPAGCVIMDAALSVVATATSAHGDVALEVHNAAIANDAASAGTEIVGADVSGNVSSPDADLDTSSDGAVGKSVSMGSLLDVDRTGAVTFFHVCAKEDLSSMTGTPKVGVWVKWMGGAAIDLRND